MVIGFQSIDPTNKILGWGCVTSAKYEQTATLLRQGQASDAPIINPEDITEGGGSWVTEYHDVTGEPIRVWIPADEDTGFPDDPATLEEEDRQVFNFPCQARSIITGGLNSQGTTERWTTKGTYDNVDYIEIQVPPNVLITKRDRITNVTDSNGKVIWREEEYGAFTPTVFDVLGVAPSLDPFGSVVEYFILAARAEIQGGTEGGTA